MRTIAVIGAGQLGSRHLQAIAKIDIPVEVQVIDPSHESLNIAKERFDQIPLNPNVNRVSFSESLDDVHSEIDVCIVATNSDVRALVIKELLLRKNGDIIESCGRR